MGLAERRFLKDRYLRGHAVINQGFLRPAPGPGAAALIAQAGMVDLHRATRPVAFFPSAHGGDLLECVGTAFPLASMSDFVATSAQKTVSVASSESVMLIEDCRFVRTPTDEVI